MLIFIAFYGSPGVYADDSHAWAVDLYKENTACTVATIKQLELAAKSVVVHLNIEPKTANGLAASESRNRDNWFALHCPGAEHPAWRENNSDFDVLISAELDSDQPYTLSCAQFYQLQRDRISRTSGTVLEKIRRLLAEKQKGNTD